LFGKDETSLLMVEHAEEYIMLRTKIEEVSDIIKKIGIKEIEKMESFTKIMKIIPSSCSKESDSFFLDIVTSIIYYEVCEMRIFEDFSSMRCDDKNIISSLFKDLLERFHSYEKIHHKLLVVIIILWAYNEYEFPSKEFDFSGIVENLLKNPENDIIKKFQYPFLNLLNICIEYGIDKNKTYILSNLFKDDISILLRCIFEGEADIMTFAFCINLVLTENEYFVERMIKKDIIKHILLLIEQEIKIPLMDLTEGRLMRDYSESIVRRKNCDLYYLLTIFVNILDRCSLKINLNNFQIRSLLIVLFCRGDLSYPFLSLYSVISLLLNNLFSNNDEKSVMCVSFLWKKLIKFLDSTLDCLTEMKNVNNFLFLFDFESINLLGNISKLKAMFESYGHAHCGNDADDV
jgi:hypothetical protein